MTQSPTLTSNDIRQAFEDAAPFSFASFIMPSAAMLSLTVATVVLGTVWGELSGKETIVDDWAGTDFSTPIRKGDQFGTGKFLGVGEPSKTNIVATSDFGEKRGDKIHKGTDIAMPIGTALYFPFKSGRVECGNDAEGWGIYATFTSDNPADPALLLGHLSQCKARQFNTGVSNPIAVRSGNTGHSTGPHLHLEQRVNGELVAPQKGYLWAMLTGKVVGSNPENLTAESLAPLVKNITADMPEIPYAVGMAILERESNFGAALDSEGKGDNGHGCGVAQVDYRYHPKFLQGIDCATDHAEIIRYGFEKVLLPAVKKFGLECGLAAYNAGESAIAKAIKNGGDCNAPTTGNDYGRDVLERAKRF